MLTNILKCVLWYVLLFLLVFHTDQDDPSSSDDEGMPYTRPVKFKAAHGFKGPYDFEQIKVVQDLSGEHMVGLKFHLWFAKSVQPNAQLLVFIYLLISRNDCQVYSFWKTIFWQEMKNWLVWSDLQGEKKKKSL